MNDSIIQIMLDMQELNNLSVVYLKKGDTARKIIITLSDGGFPYEISETSYAVFSATKPDGHTLFNYCTIDENKIIYEVTQQTTAVVGKMHCEIRLIGPNNAILNSASFLIVVDDTVTDEEVPESSSEFTALTQLMSEVIKITKEEGAILMLYGATEKTLLEINKKLGGMAESIESFSTDPDGRLAEASEARNDLLEKLLDLQEASISANNPIAMDNLYNSRVRLAKSVDEVNGLFARWWATNWGITVGTDNAARQELLKRWFGNVLDDEKVHGVKEPLFPTSQAAISEFTDDSIGLVCKPSTAARAERDDFAKLPQFWCVEVSAEKNADGTHTIYAVEFIDDIETVRSGEHLCWVLQKNTYKREWEDGGYKYLKTRCHPAAGYETWPQGTDRAGNTYPYMANPKYMAGIGNDGEITCGTGLAPCNWTSFGQGVSKWRERGPQYSGAAGNLIVWQLAMIRLKYARKSNSGTIEGCTMYSYRYTAAVSETGVKRILLTAAQANNLFVGSSVQLGDNTSTDRNAATSYNICRNRRITAITDVTVDGTAYKAVYVDVDAAFDTVAENTTIFTDPYYSGWNDTVQGYDGSRYNPTNGKEPGLIQKTEFMVGCYLILSDELWQWSKDDAGNFLFDCYTCHDQTKVTTGTISDVYKKCDDLTMVFAADFADGWAYIEDMAIPADRGVLWPKKVSKTAGSGTGVKAAMYVGKATSGVRAPWVFGHLSLGSVGGLPARSSDYGTGRSGWCGGVGAPGLSG